MAHLFQSVKVRIKQTGVPQSLPDFKVLQVNSIKANKNNTGIVYIGGHEVDSSLESGYPLEAGEALNDIHTELLGEIFISGTDGDIVHIVTTDNPVLRELRDKLAHKELGNGNNGHVNPHGD